MLRIEEKKKEGRGRSAKQEKGQREGYTDNHVFSRSVAENNQGSKLDCIFMVRLTTMEASMMKWKRSWTEPFFKSKDRQIHVISYARQHGDTNKMVCWSSAFVSLYRHTGNVLVRPTGAPLFALSFSLFLFLDFPLFIDLSATFH